MKVQRSQYSYDHLLTSGSSLFLQKLTLFEMPCKKHKRMNKTLAKAMVEASEMQ